MPFYSIAPILLKNQDFQDFPFFSGTGFFVNFPPYRDIYFVTAKHCTLNYNNSPKGIIEIPLEAKPECKRKIVFSGYILTKMNPENDFEDVIIYIVDKSCDDQLDLLKDRCLQLLHQDDINFILNSTLINNGKLRSIGYPGTKEKTLDYENKRGIVQPRGVIGELSAIIDEEYRCVLGNINWKHADSDMSGFSGSPIIALMPTDRATVKAIPVGIFSSGNKEIIKFVKINAVTDAIAAHLTGLEI